jgi:DNA-binding MarR family transcriptional regulator
MSAPPYDPAAVQALTRRMFTRIIASLARSLREEELSVAQVAALHLLDERGSMRVGDLAQELGRSAPAASRMVDDLVRRKLVARREDDADRRAKVLTLAAKGRAFVERAGEERVRTMIETVGSMPDVPADRIFSLMTRGKR